MKFPIRDWKSKLAISKYINKGNVLNKKKEKWKIANQTTIHQSANEADKGNLRKSYDLRQ